MPPVIWIQRAISAPFIGLGLWCLVAPLSVERLTVQAAFRHESATTALLIGCFGAQAMLCGLFIVLSRFTKWTFLGYGLALLLFFWFNYYFVFIVPMFNVWLSIDFVANLVMLGLCVAGWRMASRATPARLASDQSGGSRPA